MNITYPLLLDGGLSNELEREGCNLNTKLWSANLIAHNPEAIIRAHLAYLNAGAQCIITSTYQASIPGFMSLDYSRIESESFILKSIHLAEQAVESFIASNPTIKRPLIAASIGPYGAYLADGSEYHGNYGISDKTLEEFHASRIHLLDNSNADFFACETIPSFQESRILAKILKKTKKSAWISFSCKDENHINDGTRITDCADFLNDHTNIFAIGANCTAPKYISGLIKVIKSTPTSKRIVVYPNSGEAYNAESKTWIGLADPKAFYEVATEWLQLGADIIGGCCRIGHEHIRLMKNNLIIEG